MVREQKNKHNNTQPFTLRSAPLQGWPELATSSSPPISDPDANAILIFLPGAPEIDRLVRALSGSPKVAAAAGGDQLRVLPLHGALPAAAQARVFERAGRGVRKIVVATNVAGVWDS